MQFHVSPVNCRSLHTRYSRKVEQPPLACPAILDIQAAEPPRIVHSSAREEGRCEAPMSLSRESCTIQQPSEFSRRLPRVIQTYSKKSDSLAKSRSKDLSTISNALPHDLLDETSDHKDLRAAGLSPKGPVSKSIRLSLSPKQVNSLIKELVGNKAKDKKDGQTRRKLKRHRRASVHEVTLVKSYKKSSSDIEVSAHL